MKIYLIKKEGVKNSVGRELPIGCKYTTEADMTEYIASGAVEKLDIASLEDVAKVYKKASKMAQAEKRDDQAGTNVN